MHTNKILLYTFLLLTLAIVYCYGRTEDDDSQDTSSGDDERNRLSEWLDKYISKRGCSFGACSSDGECCSGHCSRRYSFNSYRSAGYCSRQMFFGHSWRTHNRHGR
ncbi:unnamed protein product [Adineta ricciae]|uniref:Uncharacterized protein n=1 Tax=Adineta ricciae TaxID=249248 RepID=A0A813S878_ADIRI|nr:unnamed protein product [Adineta ricciae]